MLEPRVLIDIQNLVANARALLSESQGRVIFPVLKANAYGHGMKVVANALEKHFSNSEIPYFCVARYTEARELRRFGVTRKILILSHFTEMDLDRGGDPLLDVDLVINSWQDLDSLIQLNATGFAIHLNLNTGMNRLGFSLPFAPGDSARLLESVSTLRAQGIATVGVMTHLACGEEKPEVFSAEQFQIFLKCLGELKTDWKTSAHGEWPRWRHVENSGGLARNIAELANGTVDDLRPTAGRPGLHLWGVAAAQDLDFAKKLKPVMEVVAPLRQVHLVKRGESVGYTRGFIASKDMLVGTVCLGYADGVSRQLSTTQADESNIGYVIHGERVPVLGRVSMDMTAVDLSDHSQRAHFERVAAGQDSLGETLAYWIGPFQGAQDIADRLDTIPYEIFCALNYRLTRVPKGEVS